MTQVLWNAQASFYGALRANPISRRILEEENQALARLLSKIPKKRFEKILDVGAGEGNALAVFNAAGLVGNDCYAVDYSEKMLRRLQRNFPAVTTVCADAARLPFADGAFDLILCVGLSEYARHLRTLLAELARALKPNGYLAITASAPTWLNRLRHVHLHALFLREERELLLAFRETGFATLAKEKTMLQTQFLLQKKQED